MFSGFINDYKDHFRFKKMYSNLKHNYYSWNDQQYREFMTKILSKLEPRQEEVDVILYNELDDFYEILYFNRGQIDIGFEINRKKYFVLRQKKNIIVAAYGCTFNINSQYIYKTHTVCSGFSLRKKHWQAVLNQDEFEDIST